jgi:uncharacterized RDD family membrane protein YckC
MFDLAPDVDSAPRPLSALSNGRVARRLLNTPPASTPPAGPAPAPVWARGVAAAIDLAVVLAIDVSVVYFTMQICGLGVDDLGMIPKTPLLAFLILQNAGYFVAFTAGGQTLGQMLMEIRVVSTEADVSPDLRHATLRTLVWAVLAIPAGLGLLTALFNTDRRGLHDRCAGTRVVRAGT